VPCSADVARDVAGADVFLVDNGEKIREASLYAKYLRRGGVIMVHDHCGPWGEAYEDLLPPFGFKPEYGPFASAPAFALGCAPLVTCFHRRHSGARRAICSGQPKAAAASSQNFGFSIQAPGHIPSTWPYPHPESQGTCYPCNSSSRVLDPSGC
jgi:hypothetical protein